MKINNKIGLKKAIIQSLIVISVFSVLFGILNFYEYKKYINNYNIKINSIVNKVIENYPDLDENDIIEILNVDNDTDGNLLIKYGIDINKDSILLKNNNYFNKFCIINIVYLMTLSLIILFIFLKYNKSKDKKLKEITGYIEEINNGNYKLYIEDNTEDELSILKNEVYKTTVMLNEVAENSKQDKINLKDSISDISHQLKTPLTSITIMLDNILDNPNMDKEIRIEFLNDIKREVININFLVYSLLKLSKLDANSVNFIYKDEKIYNIISESIKNVLMLCDLKNVKINVKGDKELQIHCDLKWQIEAITNILKNCVEHSNNNSKIDIIFDQNKLYSKIQIIDYGVGIDEKDLPHIFDRFYKGKNSSSESVGIGLALAKSIIEKNNGYISVESKLNKGTIFTIKYFN